MGKDEELLLVNLEKGSDDDSDEVVEEFKLPPPRVRRKRKNLPDARVHGGSSLFTWRCCFTFIVVSFLLSGGLILAFFIYNIHTQLQEVKFHLQKYKKNTDTIFSKHEQTINNIEAKHQSVSSFMATHEALVKKVDELSTSVKKSGREGTAASNSDTTELERQITNIKTDLQTLQSSSAKAEATLSSTQQILLKTVQQINKDVQALKVESLNPTNTESRGGDSEGTTDGIESADYMTKQEVNVLLKKFSDQVVDSQSVNSKDILDLKALYQNLNVTHNQDLLRIAKNVINFKESTTKFENSFNSLYKPIIVDLRNATQDVFKQLKLHNDTFHAMKRSFHSLREDVSAFNKTHNDAIPLTGPKTSTVSVPTDVVPQQTTLTEPQQLNTTTEPGTPQSPLTETKQPTVASTAQPLLTNATINAVNATAGGTTNTTVVLTPITPLANNGTMVITNTNSTELITEDNEAGPVLPDETNINKHDLTTEENPTNTPSHIFSNVPTRVYEQPAKAESESDYNNFQSAPLDANNGEASEDRKKPARPDENDDFSSLLSKGIERNTHRDTPVETKNTEAVERGGDVGRGWDPTNDRMWGNGGNDYDGGWDQRNGGATSGSSRNNDMDRRWETDTDRNRNTGTARNRQTDTGGSSSNTSGLSRLVSLLKGRNLTERQRQQLMERILQREGPQYNGE